MSGFNFPQNNNVFPNQASSFDHNYLENLLAQAVQKQAQNSTNMDFIIVGNKEEAERYIVQKGQTLWFRHSKEPQIYVKSVSMIGEPNFGAYKLVKLEDEPIKEEPIEDNNEQLNSLQIQYNEMQKELERLKKQVEQFERRNNGGKVNNNKSTQSQKVGE